MELGIPVVMAVNMMDIVAKNGDQINIASLSKNMGCEAVEISALKGTGITEAAEKAVALAQKKAVAGFVHSFACLLYTSFPLLSQLTFAHTLALPLHIQTAGFSCKHGIRLP